MRSVCAFCFLLAFQAPIIVSGDTETAPWQLSEAWTAEGGLKSPESAVFDSNRKVIYVSNVNGYEENGKGFLSAVSLDGEIVKLEWLTGLNAPTGMAISGNTLFVVDYNRLVEIDISSQTIRSSYPSPDINPGLNDVAVSNDGTVFVSGSETNAIYKLSNGSLTRWIQSDELKYAIGLYAGEASLYVAGFHLRRIDVASALVRSVGMDDDLQDLESIEPDGAGGYFVTQIGARPIMHLSKKGVLSAVLHRHTFSADIEFVADLDLLIAPSGGDTVVGFASSRIVEEK